VHRIAQSRRDDGTYTTNEVEHFDLQWIRKLDTPPEGILAWYTIASTSRVVYDFSTRDTSNGCNESALENYGGLEGTVLMRYDLTYSFEVKVPDPTATVYYACDDGNGNSTRGDHPAYPGVRLSVPFAEGRHIIGMTSVRTRTTTTVSPRMVGIHVAHPTYNWELVAESAAP